MMDPVPQLEIALDGEVLRTVDLSTETITVGRGSPSFVPDIELADPGSWISRRHCVFAQAYGSWWVEDCGSRNGTFLRNGEELRRLTERRQLSGDDVVCITAEADATGPISTWELRVIDPSSTRTIDGSPTTSRRLKPARPCVRWDPSSVRVEVLGDGEPRIAELRRQGYDLIAHMADRNRAGGDEPVVCTTEELLVAVWGDESGWDPYRPPTADNLRDLVLSVRKAIEPDASSPVILENQRGVGYRLHTAP